MANLRMLKKEIDYRLEELVFDCDMAICFQPTKEKEIFEVMQEGVALRNALFVKANNPADAHNPSLVRKHFAALRREIEASFGKLFEKLSEINKYSNTYGGNSVSIFYVHKRSGSCGRHRRPMCRQQVRQQTMAASQRTHICRNTFC